MKKKLHCLLISPFFFPTNTFQQELFSMLLHDHSDLTVTVVCYKTAKIPRNFSVKGLSIVQIPCMTLLKDQFVVPDYGQLVRVLGKINKDKRVDFVACETRFFESSWWVPLLGKMWNVPTILVDHCASSPAHSSKIVMFVGKILDRTLIKFCISHFSVIAVSNLAVQKYLGKLGLKNVKHIGTGVDVKMFNSSRKNVNQRLIPGTKAVVRRGEVLITFLDRLIATKGVKLFYSAMVEILRANPKMNVAIAGSGPLYGWIKDSIVRDGLGNRVFLLGHLDRKQVAQLFGITDIYVHPSWHHEGIPNVILEAGAAGCAVVASNAGGTSEVIENSETGIVLETLSCEELVRAIENLAINREKSLKLGRSLKKEVDLDYKWKTVADNFYHLIESLHLELQPFRG